MSSAVPRFGGLILATFLLVGGSLHAASATWTGGADGNWTNPDNWASSVPGVATISNNADIATFNNTIQTTITLDATRSFSRLEFQPGAGAFTFNSGLWYIGPTTSSGSVTNIVIHSGVTTDQTINSAMTPYRTGTSATPVAINFGFLNNGTGNLIINGNITGNTADFATTSQLNYAGTGNAAFNGVVANGNQALTLLKLGTGTLTLTGANTYTGDTNFGDGGLTLDFNGTLSPANDIIHNSSILRFGRGFPLLTGTRTLTVIGKKDTANTQTFTNGFTVNQGANYLDLSTSGTGTLAVHLGLMTSTTRSSGASLNINLGVGTSVTTTTLNTVSGLLPNSLTLNRTHFAAKDGADNIVPFSTYTVNTSTTLGTTNQVVDMSAGNTSITGAGTTTIAALRFNNAAATTITLDPSRMLNTPVSGMLITPNVGANLTRITGGMVSGLSTRDFIVHQHNTLGDFQIDSTITNAGTNGALAVTKSGPGTLILAGTNTYSSSTFINEGTVVVTADPTMGNTQNLTTTASSGTITGVDTTGLFIGQRLFGANINANNAQGYYITSINTGTNTITVSGTAITAGTADVIFGNSGGLGYLTGLNAVQIGFGATLQIGKGGETGGLVANQHIHNLGTLSFNRSNAQTFSNLLYGSGSLTQVGVGSTTLPSTLFYNGDTLVNNGTLLVSGDTVPTQTGGAGTRTLTSPIITDMSPSVVANLRVGQPISGSGVAAGAVVASIVDSTTITMSANATSNNTSANLAFSEGSGLGSGGAVSVTGGTLLISSTGSINTVSSVSVTGGTFRYDGTTALNRPVTVDGGRFAYNSLNNYTGAMTFTSGTLAGTNFAGNNLTIGADQILSPGNSTGTMSAGDTVWANEGTFQFELNDATGAAGSNTFGWDLFTPTNLHISAGPGQFTIQLMSLNGSQAPGNALTFDENNDYTWLFVDAGAPITGFDANKFIISGTLNGAASDFTISHVNDQLFINYVAGVIPEPSRLALIAIGFAALILRRRPRNRV